MSIIYYKYMCENSKPARYLAQAENATALHEQTQTPSLLNI